MPMHATRLSCFHALCALLLVCGLPGPQARADGRLQIDIVERATGRALPSWQHGGRRYVAGEPGVRYLVRVRNTTPRRLLAVVSVDGINVLSGETAAPVQRGYVLAPWSTSQIDGWRKSLDEVAAFYFTELPDSYAARTRRPDNVGAIGLAVFEAWEAPPLPSAKLEAARERAAPAPRADAAQDAPGAARAEAPAAARIGTGHGERYTSVVSTTEFRRASSTPEEIIVIEYDRHANLVARGIVPPPAVAEPNPFPQAFVPDPDA